MICPETLVASVTAAAISLSTGKSAEDTVMLATVFELLADSLAAIAVAKERCEKLAKEASGQVSESDLEEESFIDGLIGGHILG